MRQSRFHPVIGAIFAGISLFPGITCAEDLAVVPVTSQSRFLPSDPLPSLTHLVRYGETGPVSAVVPEDAPFPKAGAQLGPLGLPCGPQMTAEPGPGATVTLRLEAPCLPFARIRLTHEDLTADYKSSSSGILETVFPAFEETASYEAVLPNGEVLSVSTTVPDAVGYEHVATMWQSDTVGLAVHAFEFGSTAGGAGHVWRGAARIPEVADAGRGGFLLRLGSGVWPNGKQAEVYAFPAQASAHSGSVRIALGAEITQATCGQELHAVTLQIGDGLPGAPVDISLSLPDCGSESNYMMLKNLTRDLKIAAE